MYARADLEVDFCKHNLYSQLKGLAEIGNHGLTSRLCKASKNVVLPLQSEREGSESLQCRKGLAHRVWKDVEGGNC